MSSNKRGRPNDRASSRWVRKYLWFKEVTYEKSIEMYSLIIMTTSSQKLLNFDQLEKFSVITNSIKNIVQKNTNDIF